MVTYVKVLVQTDERRETLQLSSALGSNLSLLVHYVGFLAASLPFRFTLITLTNTYMDKTDRIFLFLFISALKRVSYISP